MKDWLKRIGTHTLAAIMALTLFVTVGTPLLSNAPPLQKAIVTVGLAGTAYAATPDYLVDGTADDVQVQAAMDALPTTGGRLVLFAGNYDFTTTVARAINNITIEGDGKGTYIANNGATALFSAGAQTGWVFKDFRTDAGWLTLATDTILDGELWRGTELVSNVIASGTTMPASPVVGQQFYQNATGRDVLYTYNGTAWLPTRSVGTMTVYVDATDGTDDQNHGTGVDANAYATIQYAWDQIPAIYGGNVIIYINAETYNESLVLEGKWPATTGNIYFSGTLTTLATATMDSAVQGVGATQGSITDAGAFGAYDNKLIYANSEYRLIDSDTANTANVCGVWSALPAGDYVVYDWGTIITGSTSVTGDMGVKSIIFEKIKFDGSTGKDIWLTGGAEIIAQECWFAGGWIGVEFNGLFQTWYSLIDADAGNGTVIASDSVGEFIDSKFRLNGAWIYSLRVYLNSSAYVTGGTVFDGLNLAAGVGIWAYINGSVLFDIPALGYPRLRNYASVACSADTGGQINTTANNQYSNNGVDEFVIAASYGYVD